MALCKLKLYRFVERLDINLAAKVRLNERVRRLFDSCSEGFDCAKNEFAFFDFQMLLLYDLGVLSDEQWGEYNNLTLEVLRSLERRV